MKWLKQENNTLITPPIYDEQTGTVNCQANTEWLIKHGYTLWNDEQEQNWYNKHFPSIEPIPIDMTDFNNACIYFKQICQEIGELINDPDFKGGYDDMIVFYNHQKYKTDKGMQLAIAWAGCNDLCRYEANKLGIGSPQWWYKCWNN